jgi:hypothetical protein
MGQDLRTPLSRFIKPDVASRRTFAGAGTAVLVAVEGVLIVAGGGIAARGE